jgi:type IV secretory pathway VirB2 component (pilin)
MRHIVRQWIPFFFAIGTALIVLLGYIFPNVLVFNYRGQRTPVQHILAEWAVIVASFAFVLGLWNISRVHITKAFRRRRIESLLFVFSALATLLLWLAVIFSPDQAVSEMAGQAVQGVFDYVISPVGASLAALVVVALALTAFRLLRARRSWWMIVFIPVVIIVLLTSVPLTNLEPVPGLFSEIRRWVINVFGMAGMRGLLLGVVLGTAITALRFLWPRSDS